jgi:hypothetical protein
LLLISVDPVVVIATTSQIRHNQSRGELPVFRVAAIAPIASILRPSLKQAARNLQLAAFNLWGLVESRKVSPVKILYGIVSRPFVAFRSRSLPVNVKIVKKIPSKSSVV